MMNKLEIVRNEIDRLNKQLVILLEKRFAAVDQVSAYKRQHNLPTLDRQREQVIINRIVQTVTDPKKAPFIQAAVKEIMHQSRQYQDHLRKEE